MKRKIISISLISIFSILLWVFVSFEDEFSINLTLPIQVTGVPENLALSSISSNKVSLSLKGRGWQLAQYTLGLDPKFLIPSPQIEGEEVVSTKNLIYLNSWISSAMQISDVSPEKINVKVEKYITKKVVVVPILSLQYKPGFDVISKIVIQPDSIFISGPESIVNDFSMINTERSTLNNLERETSIKLLLNKPNYLTLETEECIVSFDVQKIVDKSFENISVQTKNIPSRYELNLSPISLAIILRGGINTLSRLKNEDITAYINFDQALNDTTGSIEPIIEIPEFTSIIDTKPKKLDYIIKKY